MPSSYDSPTPNSRSDAAGFGRARDYDSGSQSPEALCRAQPSAPKQVTAGRIGRGVRTLGARLARIQADERGTTAVEFSLVAVPFLGILMAIFQTGLVLFSSEALEAAVANASRAVMTGQVQSGSIATVIDFRDKMLCAPTAPRVRILPSYFDCSKLIIDVQNGTSFAAADTSRGFYTSSSQSFNPGGAGCVVAVRVAYPLSIIFPILTNTGVNTAGQVAYGRGLTYMLQSTSLFRNEPFSTTLAAC